MEQLNKFMEKVYNLLTVPIKILNSTQLFALTIVTMIILPIIEMLTNVNIPYNYLIYILVIYIIGLKIEPKYVSSENASVKEIDLTKILNSLPRDLKIKDGIYNKIKDPLEELNFTLIQSSVINGWGDNYYYTSMIGNDRTIAMIYLDPLFFEINENWKTWYNFIVTLSPNSFTDLVVFSETEHICEQALYDKDQVKRNFNLNVIHMTKLWTDEIINSIESEQIKGIFTTKLNL